MQFNSILTLIFLSSVLDSTINAAPLYNNEENDNKFEDSKLEGQHEKRALDVAAVGDAAKNVDWKAVGAGAAAVGGAFGVGKLIEHHRDNAAAKSSHSTSTQTTAVASSTDSVQKRGIDVEGVEVVAKDVNWKAVGLGAAAVGAGVGAAVGITEAVKHHKGHHPHAKRELDAESVEVAARDVNWKAVGLGAAGVGAAVGIAEAVKHHKGHHHPHHHPHAKRESEVESVEVAARDVNWKAVGLGAAAVGAGTAAAVGIAEAVKHHKGHHPHPHAKRGIDFEGGVEVISKDVNWKAVGLGAAAVGAGVGAAVGITEAVKHHKGHPHAKRGIDFEGGVEVISKDVNWKAVGLGAAAVGAGVGAAVGITEAVKHHKGHHPHAKRGMDVAAVEAAAKDVNWKAVGAGAAAAGAAIGAGELIKHHKDHHHSVSSTNITTTVAPTASAEPTSAVANTAIQKRGMDVAAVEAAAKDVNWKAVGAGAAAAGAAIGAGELIKHHKDHHHSVSSTSMTTTRAPTTTIAPTSAVANTAIQKRGLNVAAAENVVKNVNWEAAGAGAAAAVAAVGAGEGFEYLYEKHKSKHQKTSEVTTSYSTSAPTTTVSVIATGVEKRGFNVGAVANAAKGLDWKVAGAGAAVGAGGMYLYDKYEKSKEAASETSAVAKTSGTVAAAASIVTETPIITSYVTADSLSQQTQIVLTTTVLG